MSNQYFENNPKLESNINKISYYFKGIKIDFLSDNGVFSKKQIDFGSSLLLKTIKLEQAKNVLDVGCGYGTIGLVIAKVNPDIFVNMVDVNLRAISLAKQNMDNNNIKNAEIFVSNIYENVNKKYDIIVSNPPIRAGKKVVHGISLGAYNYLNDGGSYWCVIQKKQGAESLYKGLNDVFSLVEIVEKDKGYWIIKASK